MTTTGYPHIELDANGALRVRGHGFKVIMLIGDHVYRGMGAADLVEAHPPLTLGQAYAVLAYYYDHQDALDAELARRKQCADDLRAELEDPALAQRLRDGYARWRMARV
jgi:uncharacterized protein (DUF433 family)